MIVLISMIYPRLPIWLMAVPLPGNSDSGGSSDGGDFYNSLPEIEVKLWDKNLVRIVT